MLYIDFRLVPKSVTLNDLERLNSLYFVILPNSIDYEADYVTVVEDKPIRFGAEYRLPLLAKTDQPCSTVSLRQLSNLSLFANRKSLSYSFLVIKVVDSRGA